jgi:hypothetical protein
MRRAAFLFLRSAMRISVEDELAWLRYTVQRHRDQAAQVQP